MPPLLPEQGRLPGYPEGESFGEFLPAKEAIQVGSDDLLECDEAPFVRQLDEPWQDRRNLDPGKLQPIVDARAHDHGEIQRKVGDVGKRVRGVDGEGG